MQGIQSCTPACRGANHAMPVQFQGEAARLTYLNVTEDQSADINIVTAEGDKVTLSSEHHAEATFLTYEHLAFSNSGYETQSGALVDYSEEEAVSMSVEGELSDQELADIHALLTDLGKLLKSFLSGEGDGGVEEHSGSLSRYSSLAAVEADFEYSASMQYLNLAAGRLEVDAAGSPTTPRPLPGPSLEAAQPAAAAPGGMADPLPADAAPPQAPASIRGQEEQAAGELAKKVHESGLRPNTILKRLKKFLRGLMREMRANGAVDAEQAQRGENILEKFFRQLEQPSAASESKTTQVSMMQRHVSFMYQARADVTPQPQVEEAV